MRSIACAQERAPRLLTRARQRALGDFATDLIRTGKTTKLPE
jgi:hypothetical protein